MKQNKLFLKDHYILQPRHSLLHDWLPKDQSRVKINLIPNALMAFYGFLILKLVHRLQSLLRHFGRMDIRRCILSRLVLLSIHVGRLSNMGDLSDECGQYPEGTWLGSRREAYLDVWKYTDTRRHTLVAVYHVWL